MGKPTRSYLASYTLSNLDPYPHPYHYPSASSSLSSWLPFHPHQAHRNRLDPSYKPPTFYPAHHDLETTTTQSPLSLDSTSRRQEASSLHMHHHQQGLERRLQLARDRAFEAEEEGEEGEGSMIEERELTSAEWLVSRFNPVNQTYTPTYYASDNDDDDDEDIEAYFRAVDEEKEGEENDDEYSISRLPSILSPHPNLPPRGRQHTVGEGSGGDDGIAQDLYTHQYPVFSSTYHDHHHHHSPHLSIPRHPLHYLHHGGGGGGIHQQPSIHPLNEHAP